ncbi:MAG: type IV secretion system DNA-binding domain-containing protein, partial [Nitrososphaerota archaeon]
MLGLLSWLLDVGFALFSAGLLIMVFQFIFRRGRKAAAKQVEVAEPPRKIERVCVLGSDAAGRDKGIFYNERVHMAVFGFPGTGKTRFLLSLALQDIWEGRGCMIIDPHGDLSRLVLRYIPAERWDDVIYIDPATALKYGRVVKVNFLEYRDPKDRDVVARSFMESLEKIYSRHWGPRLDMILMNAVYLLLDSGDRNVSNLYKVIADDSFREMLLSRVADQNVVSFWTNEFKKMPRDASSAVLTKIYRLVQERIVAPMFDCERSRIDFRKMMDEGRIVVVNLSEGTITSDVANFLGSLILSKVYLAGMSREDTHEAERRPFYVYVDEAYRFVTESIRDILQSLRKYKVYMTLASQFLTQYAPEIARSIPSLCDTIVTFSVGEETAKLLDEFYKPSLSYTDLVRLPRYHFAVSAIVEGRREVEVLKTIDLKEGPYNPEEVIKHSLQRWGDEVDIRRYGGAPSTTGLPHPSDHNMKPLSWIILVYLYRLYEEEFRKGGGISTESKYPGVGREDLTEFLKKEFGVTDAEVADAITFLFHNGWIDIREAEVDYETADVAIDAPYQPTPIKCVECGVLTHRPFILRDGRGLCKPCLEDLLYAKRISAESVLRPLIREDQYTVYPPKRVRAKRVSYALKPSGLRMFFDPIPKGRGAGGPEHVRAVGELARSLMYKYAFCFLDLGEEEFIVKEDGSLDHVIKKTPDIIVYPLVKNLEMKSGWDPRQWDNTHVFFIEVEIDPMKGKRRVLRNLTKCRELGKPVIFATTRGEWARDLAKILLEAGERLVFDCSGFFG